MTVLLTSFISSTTLLIPLEAMQPEPVHHHSERSFLHDVPREGTAVLFYLTQANIRTSEITITLLEYGYPLLHTALLEGNKKLSVYKCHGRKLRNVQKTLANSKQPTCVLSKTKSQLDCAITFSNESCIQALVKFN